MAEIANLESDLHEEARQRRWVERGLGAAAGLAFGMALALPVAYHRGYSTIAGAAITTVGTSLAMLKAAANWDEWQSTSEPDRGEVDWRKPEVRGSLRYAPHYLPRVSHRSATDGPAFELDKGKNRTELGAKTFYVIVAGISLGWIGVIAGGIGRGIQGIQDWQTKVATLAGSVGTLSAGIGLREIWCELAAQRAKAYYWVGQEAMVRPREARDFLKNLEAGGVPEMKPYIAAHWFGHTLTADYNKDARKQAALDRLDDGQLKNLATSLAAYREKEKDGLNSPTIVVRDGTQLTPEGIKGAFPDKDWNKKGGLVTLYLGQMSTEVEQRANNKAGEEKSTKVGNVVIVKL